MCGSQELRIPRGPHEYVPAVQQEIDRDHGQLLALDVCQAADEHRPSQRQGLALLELRHATRRYWTGRPPRLSPWKGRTTTSRGLQCASGLFLGFQRVQDYRPPDWPDQHQPQQAHLDFEVDDLDLVEAALLQLGANRPGDQPNRDKWRVLTDPAGHPFCLTTSQALRRTRRVA